VSALGESCAAARWCYFCHARCIINAMLRKQSPRWNRRPEERPGELAEAALKLFCKQGYFVTSIDDIARFAGATKGAVYHHYHSKEKLFEAAIVRYFERSFERAAADMEQHPDSDVLARIEALLRAGGEVWCSDEFPSIVCLVLGEAGQNIPNVRRTFMKMGPIRGRKAVADLIKRGQRAGVVRNDMDPLAAARIVNSGLAFGMTLVTSSGASRAGRQRQFEASLRAVLTMLSFPRSPVSSYAAADSSVQ
jgi:AcrR family transcriptional regulator